MILYREALDRLCVRLNTYLVYKSTIMQSQYTSSIICVSTDIQTMLGRYYRGHIIVGPRQQ